MHTTDFQPLRISVPDRRICFWGAPARVTVEGEYPAKLQATGANTGNLFIGHGLFHNTDCAEKRYFPGMAVIPAEQLHEHFDTVFIPASNFVNTSSDLEPWYDYFARSKVSLFCFGLGSQLLRGQAVALKPGTESFLRLLSERSGSIGVRGTFTAEVLWDLHHYRGHNLVVAGGEAPPPLETPDRMLPASCFDRRASVSAPTTRDRAVIAPALDAATGRPPATAAGRHRRLDEVFLRINGALHYLWRAVDQHGVVLDILVRQQRNGATANRFFRGSLKGLRSRLRRLFTDGLRSYGAARQGSVGCAAPAEPSPGQPG